MYGNWTIAFDLYKSKKDCLEGKEPVRTGCFLDAELAKEEYKIIDRIVQKYVRLGKHQA